MSIVRYVVAVGLLASAAGVDGQSGSRQVELGHRSAALLRVDGLEFKDLNRNGKLDAYEDWRLAPEARTEDLLRQMTLEQQAGVMVHGTLPTGEALGSIGRGDGGGYDLAKTKDAITARHVNSFITRLAGKASFIAEQNNAVQELAEGTRLGIPLTVSTNPRHHFEEILGASVGGKTFSQWPETLGFGVIGDAGLMRRFGDVARQEYAAALLEDFGIGDESLMEVITGKIKAQGKLPFELPSSVEAVEKQRSDVPHDLVAPLYKFGYGLSY